MNKSGEWSAARRVFIILMDVIVYNISVYYSFWLKFDGAIPMRNFQTFESSALFISVFFIILNVLLGTYVFYNRIISDIIFVTVIGQFLMSLGIMIITFAGRWFAFPRMVILISFIVGTVLLIIYRSIVYKAYMKLSSDKKVTILGFEKEVAPAVQNFSSQKNNKHKVHSVIIDHFYDNLTKIIKDVDIVYLASEIEESEKIKVYQLVTKEEKNCF